MTIYAEYLFIENFIAGLAILYITSVITGIRLKGAILAAGGAMCGLFSFTILLPSTGALLRSLLFSVAVVWLCFGKKGFLKSLLTFWIVSLFLGGAVTAILYLGGSCGISGGGAIYIERAAYLKTALGFVSAYTLIRAFAGFLYKRVRDEKLIKKVTLTVGDRSFDMSGYVDTGNSLREPLSGAAAIVITQRKTEAIINAVGEEELRKRYCLVPYRSAGVRSGILDAFRIDEVFIDGRRYPQSAVAAVYKGELRACGECSLLLGKEFVEGGLV